MTENPLVSAEKIDGGWEIIWEPQGDEFGSIDDLKPVKKGQIRRVGGRSRKYIPGFYSIKISDEEIERFKTKVAMIWGKSSSALAAIMGQTSDRMIAADAAVEKLSVVIGMFSAVGQKIGDVSLIKSDKEALAAVMAENTSETRKFFDDIRAQQMGDSWLEKIRASNQGQTRPSRELPEVDRRPRGDSNHYVAALF